MSQVKTDPVFHPKTLQSALVLFIKELHMELFITSKVNTKNPKEILEKKKTAKILVTYIHHFKEYNLVTVPFNIAVLIKTQVHDSFLNPPLKEKVIFPIGEG